jgi:predicted peptidase
MRKIFSNTKCLFKHGERKLIGQMQIARTLRFVMFITIAACVACTSGDFQTNDIKINGQRAVIFFPGDFNPETRYPVVMGLHGLGQSSLNYTSDGTINHQASRDLALSSGYIFCAVTANCAFGDAEAAVENVKALHDYIVRHYLVHDRFVFWTTSAGGSLGHNVIRKYPAINLGVIGTYPVYDFEKVIGVPVPPKSSPANPKSFAHKLGDRAYWIVHGTNDAVVLYSSTQDMARDVSPYGGKVHIHPVEGGEHKQGDAYAAGEVLNFYARALAYFKHQLNDTVR